MDDAPEDWEEKKRIKAEKEKAENAATHESKANLASLIPKDFATKKGFTREPEAIRQSGERLSNTGVILAALGIIGSLIMGFMLRSIPGHSAETQVTMTALSIIRGVFDLLCIISPFLAVAGFIAAIMYKKRTGENTWHIFFAAGLTILIVILKVLLLPYI